MKYLYFLILGAALVSCSGSDLKNDLDDMNLKGSVKEMTLSSPSAESKFWFNEDGFLDSTWQNNNGMQSSKGIDRDDDGRVLKVRNHFNGSYISSQVYEYSDDYLSATVTEEGSAAVIEVTYNSLGQKDVEVFTSGTETMTVEYSYDSDDRKAEQLIHSGTTEEAFDQTIRYVYNDEGFVVKMAYIVQTPYGEQSQTAEYSNFETDDEGNWISSDISSDAGIKMTVKRSISYY